MNELGLEARANYAGYDVDVDDQSLIMIQFGAGAEGVENSFVLVQDWLVEARARLPE